VLLLVAHTAVVAVASRVAGVSSNLQVAVPVAAATGIAALAASTWLGWYQWQAEPKSNKR